MIQMRLLAATFIVCLLPTCAAFGDVSAEQDCVVIDGVNLRFGDVIDVTGVCQDDRAWRNGYGAVTVRAMRINGKPTQVELDCYVGPNGGQQRPTRKELQSLTPQSHYLVRGKLMNARMNGFNNALSVVAEQVEQIGATELKVADFADRDATFEGLAGQDGKLICGDETVSVDGISAWPDEVYGRHVSVRGTVRKDAQGVRIERPMWRLYRLEDLVNMPVVLEGVIASLNYQWWFDYRGERLYLTSASGPVLHFAPDDHYRRARVSGHLVRQARPALDQISLKTARDLVPTYVVRDARVEFPGPELTWEEKFGTVYPSHHSTRNGIPELLAEGGFRRNLMGHETYAMLYAERNWTVIQQALRNLDTADSDELALRMTNENTDEVLRLLYAAMLASANDDRGRGYLRKATAVQGDELDLNALYCLGAFPFFTVDEDRKVDLAWMEQLLIDLLGNMRPVVVRGTFPDERENERSMSVASAAASYSSIPAVLRQIGSDRCRQALMSYVATKAAGCDEAAMALCQWNPPLAPADLLQIASLIDDRRVNHAILQLLLAMKSPDVVTRYLADLHDDFVYMSFRDQLSAEVVDQLRAQLDQCDGKAKIHARMLIALGQEDAVARLLEMLGDPGWTDKTIVLYELANWGDDRAVSSVARFLREAPKDAGQGDGAFVSHGLDAIAHAGTAEVIRELIELLPVDLARFGGYMDRQEWQLMVAEHLIELTGESFGTDVEQWRAWQRVHPEHRVPKALANPGGGFRTAPTGAIDLGL